MRLPTIKAICASSSIVTGATALEGSWGMQALLDDNNSIYVTDQTPQDKTAYAASFRYDPNSIGMGSKNLFTLLAGYLDSGSLTFEVQQYYNNGSRQLRAVLYLDSGSTSATSDYTITDAPHTVQIEWQAASAPGANNGRLKLTIDGQLKQTLSGKDNDTRQVDYIRLGAVAGIDSNTRGTLYLDDFRSWDPTAVVQAQFHYDGDGRRVQSVVNGLTTAFVGQYFEWTGSTSTMKKYYYFGAQRVAVRDGSGTGTTGLSWLLTDHLGSTTITLDAAGAKNAEKRYKPWGEERFTFGTLPTQYTYTGQFSHTAQFGLLFYNARWYDPYLNQWNQPDSIIPDQYTPADWNRYSYVRYNPLKFVDPDGHRPVCEGMGSCTDQWRQEKAYQRLGEVGFWKHEIKREFGITMSDSGDKSWDARNLGLMYTSLQNVDNALNGKLASFSKGTMFKLMNYTGDYEYRGLTHTDGTGIDFYTKGSAAIRQMNIYHEIGHLLDNAPGSKDVFMNAVTNAGDPSWVTDSGYVDTQNALRNSRVNDPNYRTAQAIQASTNHVAEQWADAFANYVAGNININTAAGADMNNFVTGVLAPYIGVP